PGVPAWSAAGDALLARTARLWPHRVRGEGHFAAKLRRRGSPSAEAQPSRRRSAGRGGGGVGAPSRQQLALYRAFEAQALAGPPIGGEFLLLGAQLYRLPDECPELAGLRVVRPGLHLGELKKDRFEPNHALALALPAERFR